jgi:hypothetical protein
LFRNYQGNLRASYAYGPRYAPATITFLGLWDTVGSLHGTPEDRHETCPRNVKAVAHALALDETRQDFRPECWLERGNVQPQSTVNEVWFIGAHSNVGGGYADDNLSNIAFFWVMKESQKEGLSLDLPTMPFFLIENHGAILRKSDIGYWKYLENFRRSLGQEKSGPRSILTGQKIHESVIDRINDVTLRPQRYTPIAHSGGGASFWDSVNTPEWQATWLEPWGVF